MFITPSFSHWLWVVFLFLYESSVISRRAITLREELSIFVFLQSLRKVPARPASCPGQLQRNTEQNTDIKTSSSDTDATHTQQCSEVSQQRKPRGQTHTAAPSLSLPARPLLHLRGLRLLYPSLSPLHGRTLQIDDAAAVNGSLWSFRELPPS